MYKRMEEREHVRVGEERESKEKSRELKERRDSEESKRESVLIVSHGGGATTDERLALSDIPF